MKKYNMPPMGIVPRIIARRATTWEIFPR